MKILNPKALLALAHCLGEHAVHEHSAWIVGLNLEEDTAIMKELGHRPVCILKDIATFLEHPDCETRIELITADRLAHEAWAYATASEYGDAKKRFDEHAEFEATGEEFAQTNLLAKLYRHIPTGGIVQIVWRQNPVYQNLFRKSRIKKKAK